MLIKTLLLSVLVWAFVSEAHAAAIGRLEPSLARVKRENAETKEDALMQQFIWTPGVAASVKDGMETSMQTQSAPDCAARCVEKGRAQCLSFEYVKTRRMCLLKKGNSYTVGLRLRLETTSDFYELREELGPQVSMPRNEEFSNSRAKSEPDQSDPIKPEEIPKKAESGRRGGGKNRGRGKGRNRGKGKNRQDEDNFLRKQGERDEGQDDSQETTPATFTTPEKEVDIFAPITQAPVAGKHPSKEEKKEKGGNKREKGKKRKNGKKKGRKGKKKNGKDGNRVEAKFKESGIVPDVLDTPPKEKAEVKFNDVRAGLGKTLTPTETKNQPKVKWPAEDGQLYTLVMLDPDTPSRADPRYRQWKHWLVGNIPANDISSGDVISEYISPIPTVGSGLHRYVILVYQQTKRLDFDEPRQTSASARGRGLWKVRAFAEKYGLGDPVAGNFFEAEWDKWVPKVYDQLATKRKK